MSQLLTRLDVLPIHNPAVRALINYLTACKEFPNDVESVLDTRVRELERAQQVVDEIKSLFAVRSFPVA